MGPGTTLYPVALEVAGRRCLVVGAGPVAGRKAAALVECGALVTAVAPAVHPSVEALAAAAAAAGAAGGGGDPTRQLGTLDLERRPYRAGEAAGYRLVVTATGIPAVDRAVAADAEAAGVWVNSADDVRHCTFVLPSVHRDGPVTVAVSTSGTSPALATWLRRRAAIALGPDLGALARLLEAARAQVKAQGRSTESIDWQAILDGDLPRLVRQGRIEDAGAMLAELTGT